MDPAERWPPLPYEAWHETHATLHLWLQIVGKICVVQCEWLNHSWHVALHLTARGLTTRLMPHANGAFQIEFDFLRHELIVMRVDGREVRFKLEPQSTAQFYRKVMHALLQLDIPVAITLKPNEIPNPIPFDRDEVHGAYDAEYVTRYWRVLASAACVFEDFKARFTGKSSPVHYFWGSADLAVTRFSGRAAPQHPGGVPHLPDWVAREAYSHEVSSAGFWAGGEQHPEAIFYSYAYPEPTDFAAAEVRPSAAHYDSVLREFVLPYKAMRSEADPTTALLEFLRSTYEAAADLGHWNRRELERTMHPRTAYLLTPAAEARL